MLLLWKLILVLNFIFGSVISQFENQYLGHHYTLDEYNDLELGCVTTICLRDAQRLLLAATQNKTIEPCEDFREFSMGRFIELGAINERYESLGFDNDLKLLNWERQRKVLAARINKNDIRPFKIAKNYYQNCVNSDNVRQNGTAEILEYLNSIGGAPFIDSTWDEESFNVNELFEVSDHSFYFFLNHVTARCYHDLNDSQGIVCLKYFIFPSTFSEDLIDDIVNMFKKINIDEKLTRSTAKIFNAFKIIQLKFLDEIDSSPTIFTISQLNKYTNNTLNWLKIINSGLTIESQLDNDSEILVEKPEIILNLLNVIKMTPKRILADIFAFYFLYIKKNLFIVYSFDEIEEKRDGSEKSKQRWEQCTSHINKYLGPALHALHAERYFDEETQESAKEFIKEVVIDLIGEVKNLDINEDAELDLVEKLNTIQYIVGYPDELFDLQEIEEFYDELELNGTEGIVETYLKIQSYTSKIKNSPISNSKKKLIDLISKEGITYNVEDNILYVPPDVIQYPNYHSNRSRFLNTAHLFEQTAETLIDSINEYLLRKWKIDDQKLGNNLGLAYNNYVNWEESGGKDLQLPGFFLTNRQMFWVALANKLYVKFHSHNRQNEVLSFSIKFFNILFNTNNHFREAFNCSKLTKDEEEVFKTFKEKWKIINQ